MSFISPNQLAKYGISDVKEVIYNPTYQDLFDYETDPALDGFEKGIQTNTGAIAVKTGVFTGRSPKDKYFVKDSVSENTIWWDGVINRPINQDVWKHCKDLVINQLSGKKRLYVVDTFCGTNANSRLKVRFIMEGAWEAHFVTNMFIRPSHFELANFGEPDFVFFNGSKVTNPKWKEQGLNSEVFVLFNLTEKMAVI